ncbi:hypothetical protein DFH09DRAFT_1283026 [Mycena vulgaris]|nr:hypothetical protein DFH09DRAFT_1283026 [Mycena vulgaris]
MHATSSRYAGAQNPRAPRPRRHRLASPGFRVPVSRGRGRSRTPCPLLPAPRRAHPPSACACTEEHAVPTPPTETTRIGQTESGAKKGKEGARDGREEEMGKKGDDDEQEKSDEHRRLSMKKSADGTRRRIRGHAVMQAHRRRWRQRKHSRSAATPRSLDPTPGPAHVIPRPRCMDTRRRDSSPKDAAHATHTSATRGYRSTTQNTTSPQREHELDAQPGFAIHAIADGKDGRGGEGNAGSRARMGREAGWRREDEQTSQEEKKESAEATQAALD